jgi:hypothetical protein
MMGAAFDCLHLIWFMLLLFRAEMCGVWWRGGGELGRIYLSSARFWWGDVVIRFCHCIGFGCRPGVGRGGGVVGTRHIVVNSPSHSTLFKALTYNGLLELF